MNVQSAMLAPFKDATAPRKPEFEHAAQELAELDPIVSAAVLVASAFRLRDEAALITTLRLLTSAVAAWEMRQPEPANDS